MRGYKFETRKDGIKRADLHIDVPVSEEQIKILANRLGVSVNVAMTRLKEAVSAHVFDNLGWYFAKADGTKVELVHCDEVSANDTVSEYSSKVGRADVVAVFE